MHLTKRMGAEAFGTFWLVLGGCGSAVLSAQFSGVGIGLLGVSVAFGLSVMTMAFAIGRVSGGHFNPAVTLGLAVAGRFPMKDILAYWIAQVLGSIVAAGLLYFVITSVSPEIGSFAANGYGDHSPGLYTLAAGLTLEATLTCSFIIVILAVTSSRGPSEFAPIAIGLSLTLIHLVSIPVTNTSINPARSTGPAIFVGGWALQQLWLFWVAPLIGAVIAGLAYRCLNGESSARCRQMSIHY